MIKISLCILIWLINNINSLYKNFNFKKTLIKKKNMTEFKNKKINFLNIEKEEVGFLNSIYVETMLILKNKTTINKVKNLQFKFVKIYNFFVDSCKSFFNNKKGNFFFFKQVLFFIIIFKYLFFILIKKILFYIFNSNYLFIFIDFEKKDLNKQKDCIDISTKDKFINIKNFFFNLLCFITKQMINLIWLIL